MVYVLDARQAKFGARETNQQLCDGYQFHQNDSGTELRIAKKTGRFLFHGFRFSEFYPVGSCFEYDFQML